MKSCQHRLDHESANKKAQEEMKNSIAYYRGPIIKSQNILKIMDPQH
jgi:hypothetical protein